MNYSQSFSTTTKARPSTPLSQFIQTYVSPPTNDSSAISSNYARYLSFFTVQEQLEQTDSQHQIFWSVTEKCLLYLKRQPLNRSENDQIIGHTFSHFLDLSKLDPTPTNQLGKRFIKNGYFLAAYAQLLSRLKNTLFYSQYFASLYQNYEITMGRSELFHYLGADTTYQALLKKERSELKTVERPVIRKSIEQLQYSVKTCF